jgi:trehalose 6-phosphate synthase/phosphatase
VLLQRYAGMKIVVGRDKLDEVQGVRHKILAFERFLERYKEFQGKVSNSIRTSQCSPQDEAGILGGSDPNCPTNYGIQ